MSDSLGLTVVIYALVVAAWCAVCAVTGGERPPAAAAALGLLQLAVTALALLDLVDLLRGHHGSEVCTNAGYLIAAVLILPTTAAAIRLDRHRWGSAGFAVGCIVVLVVSARLQQTLQVTRA